MAPSVYPTLSRSTGVGAAVAFGRMGAIAGPLIAGHLLAIGLSAAAVLIAAIPCVVLAGMCALLLVATRRVSRVDENRAAGGSEEHKTELQSLMRISYAVFCLKKNRQKIDIK